MIETSEEFKEAVYAPARKTTARTVFSLVNLEADTIWHSSTNPPPISRLSQVTNMVWDTSQAYGTYERDYWRLDGSFVIPPRPSELPFNEVGWWSGAICDENGIFTDNNYFEVGLRDPTDVIGLSVVFDRAANEYARDIDIELTCDGQKVVKEIRDNDGTMCVLWEPIEGITEIKVIILRWAKPYRRARVAELLFGPIEEMDAKMLVDVNVLHELDPTGLTAPASELTFRVNNSDRRFNALSQDGLNEYLQQRQRITCQMGVEVDSVVSWINMGTFFLNSWKNDEGMFTASFVARDHLDLLDGPYEGFNAVTPTLLSTIAHDIRSKAFPAILLREFVVPEFFDDIQVVGRIPQGTSLRQAFLWVAQIGETLITTNRDGKVHFVSPQWGAEHVDTISYKKAHRKPRIEQLPAVRAVVVNIFNTDPDPQIVDSYVLDLGPGSEVVELHNPLVTTQATAQRLAQWIAQGVSHRHVYVTDWRQNPALEVGDPIKVQNDYEDLVSLIMRHDYRWNGALKGSTRTRGSWHVAES